MRRPPPVPGTPRWLRRILRQASAALAGATFAVFASIPMAGAEEDETPVQLWPIVQRGELPDGKRRTMVLLLYHRTINPDGSTHSFNVLNYLQSPTFTALFPLFYRVGPAGAKHTMLVPLWFQGPHYAGAPALLSGAWTRRDGSRSLWITPLFHADTAADGSLNRMHALNYFQGDGYRVFFPLAYQARGHRGVLPIACTGPGYWTVPLGLSAGWRRDDGGRTTWITPLFHVARDRAGAVEHLHVGPYLHGRDYDLLFPLAWRSRGSGPRSAGVLPLWLQGPGWWCAPPALSGRWRTADGGASTWLTPLAHVRTTPDGRIASWHLLNWFHGRELDVFAPVAWRSGPPGQRTGAVLPLFLKGTDWWCAPPLLAGWIRRADSRSTWVTPLFHRTTADDGRVSQHLLTWFSGRSARNQGALGTALPQHSYHALFPLFYRFHQPQGERTATHTGVVPLVFAGPGYAVVPPALSAWWRRDDGGTSTWITPLFRCDRNRQGAVERLHALPFYIQNRRWWLSPLLLTGGTRGADATTWVTPLFHRSSSVDGSSDMHLLTYVSGRSANARNAQGQALPPTTWRVLFPLFYRTTTPAGDGVATRTGLVPLVFRGPDYTVIPPALSGRWQLNDGSTTTWITPLAHRRSDAQGALLNQHLGPWFQGRRHAPPDAAGNPAGSSSDVLFPLFYQRSRWSGGTTTTHRGVVPLWFSGPDCTVVPPLLSLRARSAAGDTTWVTPLFHVTRDRDRRVTSMHALNYVRVADLQLLLPLAYRSGPSSDRHIGIVPLWFHGRDYRCAPLALSWWRRRGDGGSSTWITPLFHVDRDRQGRLDHLHVLTYAQTRTSRALFPFAYATGSGTDRHRGVVPLWFSGPGYWAAPLALSASWRRGADGRTTWVTPLFHRTTRNGRLVNQHVLTYVATRNTAVAFPLYWRWRSEGGDRRSLLAPLYYHCAKRDGERTTVVLPALFAHHRSARLDTSLPRQLVPFLVQRAQDGNELNLLWRLFHRREHQDTTSVTIGPLWWSQRRRGTPARWQVLGGLAGREVNYRTGTSRAYLLWGIPLGGRRPFPNAVPAIPEAAVAL